ncbi:MAG: HDOD domain-containing protein [Thermodesulfobacteria bacterium]|nr:HDOD domain-containing protein [Thermodesulfobacteriota bacterium]
MSYALILLVIVGVVLVGFLFWRGGAPQEDVPLKHRVSPRRRRSKSQKELPPEIRNNKLYYREIFRKRSSCKIYSLEPYPLKTSRDLTEEQKEFLYQELKRFPLPSGAAMQLSEMLRDPYVDSRKVAALASTDPVVSARLLAVVNSAYFRPRSGKKVSSIHRAILLLGFNQVRNLLFQLVLEHAVSKHSPLSKEEIQKIWLHSASVSVAAGEIAKRYKEHPGLVLTAGLMHDIGKFFLPYFQNQEEVGSFLAHEMGDDLPPLIQEENLTGFNHAVIGSVLCYIWKLPHEISQAVVFHHFGNPERLFQLEVKMRRVITTVAVADYICHLLGYAGEEPYLYEIPKQALEACGFPAYPEFLITPELEKEVEKMVNLLKEYSL